RRRPVVPGKPRTDSQEERSRDALALAQGEAKNGIAGRARVTDSRLLVQRGRGRGRIGRTALRRISLRWHAKLPLGTDLPPLGRRRDRGRRLFWRRSANRQAMRALWSGLTWHGERRARPSWRGRGSRGL